VNISKRYRFNLFHPKREVGVKLHQCKEEDTSRTANVQQKTVISPKAFDETTISPNRISLGFCKKVDSYIILIAIKKILPKIIILRLAPLASRLGLLHF